MAVKAASPFQPQGAPLLVKFFKTSRGASYTASAITHLADGLSRLSLGFRAREVVSAVSHTASAAGLAFVVPDLVEDVYTLQSSVVALQSDGKDKTALKTTRVAMNFLTVVNTTSDALTFLDGQLILSLGRRLPLVNAVYYSTSLVTDSWEIAEAVRSVSKSQAKSASQPQKQSYFTQKIALKRLTILKSAVSIALSVASFVSITLSFAAGTSLLLAAGILALSVLYLTLKITSFFQEKIVSREKKALSM